MAGRLTAKGKLMAGRLTYRWPKRGREVDGEREVDDRVGSPWSGGKSMAGLAKGKLMAVRLMPKGKSMGEREVDGREIDGREVDG